MTKVITFIEQIKQEAAKVSWPSRKETSLSTMIIIVAVVVASLFFLIVDMSVHKLVQLSMKIGN